MADPQTNFSIWQSIVPLIGVIVGSAVTFSLTVFITFTKNKREDYTRKREKGEQLYVQCIKYREYIYGETTHVLRLGSLIVETNKTDEVYNLQVRDEKAADLISTMLMLSHLYFPQVSGQIDKIIEAGGETLNFAYDALRVAMSTTNKSTYHSEGMKIVEEAKKRTQDLNHEVGLARKCITDIITK